MITIPTVTHQTATNVIDDIFRDAMENGDGAGLVIDWIRTVGDENPELMMAITSFAGLYDDVDTRSAFLAGMAIAYRAISAQAEVTELERMRVIQ